MKGSHRLLAGVILCCAFVCLAIALPRSGGMPLDISLAMWLAAHATDTGGIIFTWISWLGDTALSGLLVAAVLVLVYRRRYAAAVTTTLATFVGMEMNVLLKQFIHRGRPDYAIEFLAGTTWSFPSGHTMASIIGFGIVAFFRTELEPSARRRAFVAGMCGVTVLAVAFSRLYLGVHYLSDVLGGLIAGAIWLLLCLEGYRRATKGRSAGVRN